MALNANATWSGGLKDGKVRTSDGDVYDINAVVSMEGDPQTDEIVIKGDDETKATLYLNQTEKLSVKANGISFDTLQAMTGNSYASSPTGIEIPLGTDSQSNPPFVELTARSRAMNADGTAVDLVKTWHKVQLGTPKISQAGEKEVNVEWEAMAYKTNEDIVGGTLNPSRVATLAIGPVV